MRVLPVQHREIAPPPPGAVIVLDLARQPACFFFFASHFHDANTFSFCFVRVQHLVGEVRAGLVVRNCLRRHAQKTWNWLEETVGDVTANQAQESDADPRIQSYIVTSTDSKAKNEQSARLLPA